MNRQKPRVLQQFEEQGYVVIKGLLDCTERSQTRHGGVRIASGPTGAAVVR